MKRQNFRLEKTVLVMIQSYICPSETDCNDFFKLFEIELMILWGFENVESQRVVVRMDKFFDWVIIL